MPVGPQGQKSTADVLRLVINVAKIPTRQIKEDEEASSAAAKLGKLDGIVRAKNATAWRRSEVVKNATLARFLNK